MMVLRGSRSRRQRWPSLALASALAAWAASFAYKTVEAQQRYDVVLAGGRVMDPETGLDDVRNVGIRGDRIAEISREPLDGARVIDVSGHVVAPGFIDLHAHGQTNQANEFQAHDGVTTALELEGGETFVREWIESRRSNALLNYGATIAQRSLRAMAMDRYSAAAERARELVASEGLEAEGLQDAFQQMWDARYEPLTSREREAMSEALSSGLAAGALGIGVPVGYYPGASREEIFRVYEFAAKTGAPIYTHVRSADIPAIQEAIANAAGTGASLHIVHLNSMALGDIGVALDMVAGAQAQGLDVTTELYPYTAASTSIESVLFDEGWQELWGIGYGDIQWQDTGERLTEESFGKYREQGGTVILHVMKEEWIERGIRAPFTIIGSDGMPYAPGAHPRSAGTFARVLGRYVRERKVLSLMTALGKMTLMPARRLEPMAPGMRLKGRLQVDCDADIAVFDPARVIDTATFEADLSFSEGIPYVMVNGTLVVDGGETVEGVYPGRPIVGKYRR